MAFSAAPPQRSMTESFRWLTWPLVLMMLLLPVCILAGARKADLGGLMVAYVNVIVIGMAMIYFIRADRTKRSSRFYS